MDKRHGILLKIIKALFLVKAVIWIMFALYYFFQIRTQVVAILSLLLFIDGIIFLWISFAISKAKWIYYFAIIFLALNIIVAFFDQLGLADYFLLAFDVILFILLLSNVKAPINCKAKNDSLF